MKPHEFQDIAVPGFDNVHLSNSSTVNSPNAFSETFTLITNKNMVKYCVIRTATHATFDTEFFARTVIVFLDALPPELQPSSTTAYFIVNS